MPVVNVVVGAFLLTLGRKIFWLFVAASGFYAGLELASRYLNLKPDWVALLIALAVGLLGALLAYFFQKLAVGAAGFLAGVFIASRLVSLLGTQVQVKDWDWLLILIGGIIGIVLMIAIFEWALIILSSLAGAILIVEALNTRHLSALSLPLSRLVEHFVSGGSFMSCPGSRLPNKCTQLFVGCFYA